MHGRIFFIKALESGNICIFLESGTPVFHENVDSEIENILQFTIFPFWLWQPENLDPNLSVGLGSGIRFYDVYLILSCIMVSQSYPYFL